MLLGSEALSIAAITSFGLKELLRCKRRGCWWYRKGPTLLLIIDLKMGEFGKILSIDWILVKGEGGVDFGVGKRRSQERS